MNKQTKLFNDLYRIARILKADDIQDAKKWLDQKFETLIYKFNDLVESMNDSELKKELMKMKYTLEKKRDLMTMISIMFLNDSKELRECDDAFDVDPKHEIKEFDKVMMMDGAMNASMERMLEILYERDVKELEAIKLNLQRFAPLMDALENDVAQSKKNGVKYKWVTVYKRSRPYGGPEEGGWYYDNDDVEVSLPFSAENLQKLSNDYNIKVKDPMDGWGTTAPNREGYWIAKERNNGENENTDKPHYE